MGKDKRDKIILALLIAVVLLLGFLGYLFLIQPALSGLVSQGQTEGMEYAITYIAQQAATCNTVPLTVENQTINLVAVECLQQEQASSQ